MGHYAKVVNNVCDQVIVADAEFFDTFVDSSPGQWLQVSYNTRGGIHYDPTTGLPSADQSKALRGNYPGIGFLHDPVADKFYPPKPFASWTLNQTTWLWDAPIAMPSEGGPYMWDESVGNWVAVVVPA